MIFLELFAVFLLVRQIERKAMQDLINWKNKKIESLY